MGGLGEGEKIHWAQRRSFPLSLLLPLPPPPPLRRERSFRNQPLAASEGEKRRLPWTASMQQNCRRISPARRSRRGSGQRKTLGSPACRTSDRESRPPPGARAARRDHFPPAASRRPPIRFLHRLPQIALLEGSSCWPALELKAREDGWGWGGRIEDNKVRRECSPLKVMLKRVGGGGREGFSCREREREREEGKKEEQRVGGGGEESSPPFSPVLLSFTTR